jgi:predicted nuclease of predicted toxin-antitoxin system
MPLAFKVDEDLPLDVAERLRTSGFDATTVSEQALSGTPDEALWPIVQREGRCLVTADKGFANAQVHPPGTHAGIILFRLPQESRAGYVRLTDILLASGILDTAKGAIVVVSPDTVRVHRGSTK